MAGGVRVDLEALGRSDVIGRLQEPSAQRDGFLMRGLEAVDPQVEMDLLRRPVGPFGRNMVRRELNAEPPFAVDQHAVPIVSATTVPPSIPAQKVLSVARSAASKTTICGEMFVCSSFHGPPKR